MTHHFDRSGKLSPVPASCPEQFRQLIERLRTLFPALEIQPEQSGKLSFQAKHAGKWRAWHFEDRRIPEDAFDAAIRGLRQWIGEGA